MQSRAWGVNVTRMQGKSTILPGECLDRLDKQPAIALKGNPVREGRLRWQESAEAIVPGVFFREGLNNETLCVSTMSSSRDEPGRQKLSDRETAEQTKQVKPVGDVQSAALLGWRTAFVATRPTNR